MAASTDFQVVPETGVEVELLAVEACDGAGSRSATTMTKESVKLLQDEQLAVEACDDVGSNSATTTMDESAKVLQEQPAFEACDGAGSRSATTMTEESVTVLREQRDTTPEPAHREAVAPKHAAEVSASEEPVEEEKPHPHVAKEDDEGEQKVPAAYHGDDQESTRERLKRHRQEMAGRVWVPEMWGQEKLLKDWVDSAVFDRPLVPAGLLTARRALVAESCTRRPDRRASTVSSAGSSPLRVRNRCST